MLQNAVFHLLQPIVVMIELFLNFLEVKVVGGISVPRQVEHGVEIGILYRIVW